MIPSKNLNQYFLKYLLTAFKCFNSKNLFANVGQMREFMVYGLLLLLQLISSSLHNTGIIMRFFVRDAGINFYVSFT